MLRVFTEEGLLSKSKKHLKGAVFVNEFALLFWNKTNGVYWVFPQKILTNKSKVLLTF